MELSIETVLNFETLEDVIPKSNEKGDITSEDGINTENYKEFICDRKG